MNVTIKIEEKRESEDSINLLKLGEMIEEECDVPVKYKKGECNRGEKITPIEAISLTLATLSTLISVLSYWKSKQPQYTITIPMDDNKSISVGNISDMNELTNSINNLDELSVIISKKK
ncbi:hypothetical protein MHK_005500 [Candidatus Magnetomorum sp. HK-1]|nr:hypothetical protein MHK_005500 [Candidatus Magnetomorum sp. HK-1]